MPQKKKTPNSSLLRRTPPIFHCTPNPSVIRVASYAGAHRTKKSAISFQNPRRSGESRARQVGCQNPVKRGFTGMKMFTHRAVCVELPKPCRLRSRAAQRIEHPRRVELQQGTRRGRGAEGGRGSGLMKETVMTGIHRFADPQRSLKTESSRRAGNRVPMHARARRPPKPPELREPRRATSILCAHRRAREYVMQLRWRARLRRPRIFQQQIQRQRRNCPNSQPRPGSFAPEASSEPASTDPNQSSTARRASATVAGGRLAQVVRCQHFGQQTADRFGYLSFLGRHAIPRKCFSQSPPHSCSANRSISS